MHSIILFVINAYSTYHLLKRICAIDKESLKAIETLFLFLLFSNLIYSNIKYSNKDSVNEMPMEK